MTLGWNRNFTLLAVAVFTVGAFFGVQLTLFNNFIVERLGIEPHELGVLEALRETPGFLNALFIAVAIHLAPPVVGGVSLMIMGVGIMAYAKLDFLMGIAPFTWVYDAAQALGLHASPSLVGLVLFSFIWSVGFHCWVPLRAAMALNFSSTEDKGKWLGQLQSVGSVAWLLSIGFCYLTYSWLKVLDYEGLFVVAGSATVLGGFAILLASRQMPELREPRLVFRRKYGIYYALNFLQGCRKQMFITFALFALVKVHGMSAQTAIKLAFINQIVIMLTAPYMGKLVDRFGERMMLSLSYVGLALVFLGYAVIQHRPSLYVLYCIDNAIFVGGIALTTYINKIAKKQEMKSTLSMGVTMNHFAAVIAPFAGGFLWQAFGYQLIFFGGAVLALISLGVSQWVRPDSPSPNLSRT